MPATLLRSADLAHLSYSPEGDRFDGSWEAPLATLLGLGRAAGADFVEIFLERSHYLSTLVEEDRLTSVSPRGVEQSGSSPGS